MTNSFTAMVGLVDALAMLYTFTGTGDSLSSAEKTRRDTLQRRFDSCFDKQNTSI